MRTICGVFAVLVGCGGAAPCPVAPATPTPAAPSTPGAAPDGTPATPGEAPAAPPPRWSGTLLYEDGDRVGAIDVGAAERMAWTLRARLVEGLRNVGDGAAAWVHWKDSALAPHALRLHRDGPGLDVAIVEAVVDDVSPDGKAAIVMCPKAPKSTCLAPVTADGLGEATPIAWPKGAGRVHGWTRDAHVLVLTSTNLKRTNLIEFEPRTGKQTPRGTLPPEAKAFFDRDGRYVAWYDGGGGKALTLAFRGIGDADDALRRIDLGVAHDARCEPTPANDAWACVVSPAAGAPGRLIVAELGATPRELATDIEKVYGPFAWSPAGDAIAVAQARGDKSVLAVVPLTGSGLVDLWQDDAQFVSRPRPLGWLAP